MASRGGRCGSNPPDAPRDWLLAAALAAILLLILAGCATPQLPEVVKIPVAVPCVREAELPRPPTVVSDADLARMDDYDLVLTLAADRDELLAAWIYAAALLKGCVVRPAPGTSG
jgi:hypothetical protein